MSRIEIILGCMFSGKTTELMRRLDRQRVIGRKILIINSDKDNRVEGDMIKTHSNQKQEAVKLDRLMLIVNSEKYKEAETIGIDEAQFFPDLIEFVEKCESDKKSIVIAGLNGDYQRKPIGDILKIIPMCEDIVLLSAMDMVSKDGRAGHFTKRIINNDSQILVGSTEYYMAVSRENHHL